MIQDNNVPETDAPWDDDGTSTGDNKVSCDNTAPGAAKGLVGENGKPAECVVS